MMTFFNQAFGNLRCDERGTGLIELAMVAPVLALLTVGIVDLTEGVSRRMELHDAVHRTLEKVAARRFIFTVTNGEVDTEFMKRDSAEAAGVDEDEVTVTAWLECDGVEQPDFDAECPPLSSPDPECSDPVPPAGAKCQPILARYVQVRIDTSYSPTFGKVVTIGSDGTVPLFAEAAVRIQ